MILLMKPALIAAALALLAACAPPPQYEGAADSPRAQTGSGGTGVTVSGSARVGVSRTF